MKRLLLAIACLAVVAAGCGGPSAADGEIDPRTLKAPEVPPGMENQTAAAADGRQPMAGATPTPAGEPPPNR